VYVLPATMFAAVLSKKSGRQPELYLCRAMQVLGVIVGALGVAVTLAK
jgi:hypothetical protein